VFHETEQQIPQPGRSVRDTPEAGFGVALSALQWALGDGVPDVWPGVGCKRMGGRALGILGTLIAIVIIILILQALF
jgi:hypothetical protein